MNKDLFPEDRILFREKYDKLKEQMKFAPRASNQFGAICSGQMGWHDHQVLRKAVAYRAWSFASLCRAFTEKYGKEAEDLIKRVQWDAGMVQCKRWAEFAGVEMGKVPIQELPAIICSGAEILFPWAPITVVKLEEGKYAIRTLTCIMAEAWSAIQFPADMSKLYCHTDFSIFSGLNHRFVCERSMYIPDGDPYCEYIVTVK